VCFEIICLTNTLTPDKMPLFLFTIINYTDPTTKDRQGNDAGTQYASWIFCSDNEQIQIANKVKTELQQFVTAGKISSYSGKTVSTDIGPTYEFYPAQAEHQEYLDKNPSGYCNHRIRFNKWPADA
jgi:peptide-methionine (S)-S-oxide reductase